MMITIILLLISSYSLMLSPASDFDSDGFSRILAYAIGVVFWLGLISAYVIFIGINKERKKRQRSSNRKNIKRKTAALTFFSSKPAAIADIVSVVCIIPTIIIIRGTNAIPQLFQYFIISTLIFSVQMHFILNGRNFRCLFSPAKKKREDKSHDDLRKN